MSERVKQSIPLGGINTAVPTTIVPDGALEDAMNVRHKNGALQNVCAPAVIHPITMSNGYTIIHRMDALPENEYIAQKIDQWGSTAIDHVAIENGEIIKIATIDTLLPTSQDVKCSSFGNVLFVNYIVQKAFNSSHIGEKIFANKNGAFRNLNLNELTPPEFSIEVEERKNANTLIAITFHSENDRRDLRYAGVQQELKNDGFIVGAFYIALAYKMNDGNIIKLSTPMLSYSRLGPLKKRVDNNSLDAEYSTEYMAGDKVKIRLPQSIAENCDELIKSITVFTSRVFDVYNIDCIDEYFNPQNKVIDPPYTYYSCQSEYITHNYINNYETIINLSEPLYEMADIDFRSNEEFVIDYEKIKNIVHNPIYTPSYSHHTLIGRGKMEYNNRLHLYNTQNELYGNIIPKPIDIIIKDTRLFPEYEMQYVRINGQIKYSVEYTMEIDNHTVVICKQFEANLWKKEGGDHLYIRLINIAVYPDARATTLKLYIRDTTGVIRVSKLQLEKVLSQNFSFARLSKLTGTEDLINQNAYIDITTGTVVTEELPAATAAVYEKQTNRLYVSAMNNPFFVAAQNIYSIGESGSKIEAINTATEQISETRFGAYPIYIFSDRAIHAMETGTDNVLYSSVIGVSNERKLLGTTTVGAANAVMFVGDKGVMALEGRYAVCLSTDINDAVDADLELVAFETYYRGAQLLYNSKENELIVYNAAFDYAYIYSLYSKVWTRRNWSGTQIGSRQIVTTKGVCSLLDEDRSKPVADVQIITRPLKLGAMELKRVETAVARMSAGLGSNYSITLEGSNDGRVWQQLGKVTDHSTIRRTPSSAVYHRLSVWANVKDRLSVTHFDVEFYLRFARRMR